MSNSHKEPFDPTVKLYYVDYFIKKGLWATSQREVFSYARAIDVVVVCKATQIKCLQTTVFKHFEELNAIEFKGKNDNLNTDDFNKIQMRAWALAAYKFKKKEYNPKRRPDNKTVTIICHTRPTKILDKLKNVYNFKTTPRNGVYHSRLPLNTYIIYPTELDIIPENYALLALARGEKLNQFIDHCFQKNDTENIKFALRVGYLNDPDTIFQRLSEDNKMDTLVSQKTTLLIEEIAKDYPKLTERYKRFRAIFAYDVLQQGIKKGIREGIEIGLRLKFNQISDQLFSPISKITDLKKLKKIQAAIFTINDASEFKQFVEKIT